jgi:uncharacterized protein
VDLKVYPTDSPFAAMVVAHGAGAGQTSQFVVRTAEGLARRGVSAATFDFPYMAGGRKIPDRPPVLEAAWREALEHARRQFTDVPLFIGGKSMGGRIASQVAARHDVGALAGLVLLGYPLHPPGNPAQRRDQHLPDIIEPVLFVQGSRDTFGTSEEIRALLPFLPRATLHEITGGDHSFKGSAQQRASRGGPDPTLDGILDVVTTWMRSVVRC